MKVVQWVGFLVCNHEDLSLNEFKLQHQCEIRGTTVPAHNTSTGDWQTQRACWPAGQVKTLGFCFSERPPHLTQ